METTEKKPIIKTAKFEKLNKLNKLNNNQLEDVSGGDGVYTAALKYWWNHITTAL